MDEDQDLIDRIRAMAADGESQPTVMNPPRTDYASGALQGALALGTSYLSRRIDIDLQSRVTGSQPGGQRPSNQRPVSDHADLTTRAVASAGGVRIGDLVPWLVVGGIALLMFRRFGGG